MTEQSRRVRLPGDLKGSAHTIEIMPDGTLVAELYDFSDDVHKWLGGDFAWGIKVAKETQPELLALLRQDAMFHDQFSNGPLEDQLGQLLPLFPNRFTRYHDFKSWLQESGIQFTEYTDPFA